MGILYFLFTNIMILQVYEGKNISGHIGNSATDIRPAKKEAMSGHKVSDTATGKQSCYKNNHYPLQYTNSSIC